jgi:hypothetical protein
MTPRALLTSIRATAIAFAVAIGIATGSANGVNTSGSAHIAVAVPTAHDYVRAYEWSVGTSMEGERLASWNDPCMIAV